MAGSPSQQTTVQKLPPEVRGDWLGALSRARREASRSYKPYKGRKLAPFSRDELQAQRGIRQMASQGELPEMGRARQSLERASEYAGNVPMWNTEAYKKYSSPYFEDVIDIERRRLGEDWDTEIAKIRNRGVGSSAFGFSDMGDELAAARHDKQRDMYETGILGRERSWTQGLGAFQADRTALSDAATMQQNLSTQYRAVAEAKQQQAFQRLSALADSGASQRELEQEAIRIAIEDFEAEQRWNRDMISWQIGQLRATGLGASQHTEGYAAGPSTAAQVFGGLASTAGAVGSGITSLHDAGLIGGNNSLTGGGSRPWGQYGPLRADGSWASGGIVG